MFNCDSKSIGNGSSALITSTLLLSIWYLLWSCPTIYPWFGFIHCTVLVLPIITEAFIPLLLCTKSWFAPPGCLKNSIYDVLPTLWTEDPFNPFVLYDTSYSLPLIVPLEDVIGFPESSISNT